MVRIFTTPTCPYCQMAKRFFKEHDVSYEEFDVSTDEERAKEMTDLSGQTGVPVIDVDGTIVIGFDEERLRELLQLE